MATQLTAEAVIRAVDMFSQPVKNMANALDAFTSRAERRMKSVSETFGETGSRLSQVGQRATAVAAISFASAVKSYADYEERLVKIKKVFDGPGGDSPMLASIAKQLEFNKIENGLLRMSAQIPVVINDLAELAEVASGAGMNKSAKDLLEFTQLGAEFAKAFDMPAKRAAEALASLKIQFNLSMPQLRLYADMMNHLGNETLSKEKDIVEVMSRVAGSAAVFGEQSRGAMTALASTFLALKVPANTAAVTINNLISRLSAPTKATEAAFERLGMKASDVSKRLATDFGGAVTDLLKAVNKLPPEERLGILKQMVGDYAARQLVKAAANDAGEYAKQLGLIADASKYAGSTQKEFLTTSSTMNARLILLHNQIGFLAKTLVSDFFPQISQLIGAIGAIGTTLAAMPGWVKSLAVFGAAAAAIGPVLLVVAGGVYAFTQSMFVFAAAARSAALVATVLGALLSPFAATILGTVAAVAALAAGLYLLWKSGGNLGVVFSMLGEIAASVFRLIGGGIIHTTVLVYGLAKALGSGIWAVLSSIGDVVAKLAPGLANAASKVWHWRPFSATPADKLPPLQGREGGKGTLSGEVGYRLYHGRWAPDGAFGNRAGRPPPMLGRPSLHPAAHAAPGSLLGQDAAPAILPPLQSLFEAWSGKAAERIGELNAQIAALNERIQYLSGAFDRFVALEDRTKQLGGVPAMDSVAVQGALQARLREKAWAEAERSGLIRDFSPAIGAGGRPTVTIEGHVTGKIEADIRVDGGTVTNQSGGEVSGPIDTGRGMPDTGAR